MSYISLARSSFSSEPPLLHISPDDLAFFIEPMAFSTLAIVGGASQMSKKTMKGTSNMSEAGERQFRIFIMLLPSL